MEQSNMNIQSFQTASEEFVNKYKRMEEELCKAKKRGDYWFEAFNSTLTYDVYERNMIQWEVDKIQKAWGCTRSQARAGLSSGDKKARDRILKTLADKM